MTLGSPVNRKQINKDTGRCIMRTIQQHTAKYNTKLHNSIPHCKKENRTAQYTTALLNIEKKDAPTLDKYLCSIAPKTKRRRKNPKIFGMTIIYPLIYILNKIIEIQVSWVNWN